MLKLFKNTKNSFRTLGLSLLGAALLSACGGGGSCAGCAPSPSPTPTPTPGELTLTLTAPNQYPAGVAVTAYLTMTNTSATNATNLIYDVPYASNYTGATITVLNGAANNPCVNIAAGQSCTFPATISANSHPGSFTVTATPSGSASVSSVKKLWDSLKSDLGLQASTLSLTANIGLTDLPTNSNSGANGISFLYSSTIAASESGETLLSIVGVVNSATAGVFNTINLTDQNGDLLNFSVLSNNSGKGATALANGSIVTFLLRIPAGTSNYQFYAQTMQDGSLVNQGTTVNPINLANSQTGILVVQPTDFNLTASPVYESQIVTYTNIGNDNVSNLSIVSPLSPLSLVSNTCKSSLAAGASCTVVVVSNALAGTSGTGSLLANYNTGSSSATTVSQYNYAGKDPLSGISLSAVNNFIFEANTAVTTQTTQVTLTNTGNVIESNFVFSFSPNQYFTLSAGDSGTPCTLSGNTVTNNLEKSQSCTVTLEYVNSTVTNSGTSTMSVDYKYSGSLSGSSSKVLTYSTVQATANLSVSPASPYTFNAIAANNVASESVTFTYTNNGPDVARNVNVGVITGADSAYFSVINNQCGSVSNIPVGGSCTVKVKFGPSSIAKENATATLPISISSTTGGKSQSNTVLAGTLLAPGMAFLTAVNDTAADPMNFGFLNTTSPYWLNPNTNGILKFTITNIGTATATNIIYRRPNMGFCPLDIVNTTCGNDFSDLSSSTLTVGSSCTLQFTCNEPQGSMDQGSSVGIFTYNDEARPTGNVVQRPEIDSFGVNIVVPASVSAVMSYESSGSNPISSVNAESDFYVVYKLSNGYQVSDQVYGVNLAYAEGGTPPISAYAPGRCVLSSSNPTCYVKLNAGGAAENQKIIYTAKSATIDPEPSDSGYFNVVGSTSVGSYAYVTNYDDSVTKCSITANGDLTDCAYTGGTLTRPSGIAITPSKTHAYIITNSEDDPAVVTRCTIEPADGSLFDCNNAGATNIAYSSAIAIDSSGTHAYITNYYSGTVTYCFIDPITANFAGCADSGATFSSPRGVAMNQSGSIAYVTNSNSSIISGCDVGGGSDDRLSNCTSDDFSPLGLTGIAINSAGNRAFITSTNYNYLLSCPVIGKSISAGCSYTPNDVLDNPYGVALNADETIAYVVNYSNETVSKCAISGNGSISGCTDSGATNLHGSNSIAIWSRPG